jgi:ABC-type multidrug transport system fused ATPase/permease subunit
LIRQTLTELRGRVTIIVISHRLGAVEDCDLLLVLDKGRVADFGPSSEVLTRDAFREVAKATTGERALLDKDYGVVPKLPSAPA